jgi:hypothetical protein
LYTTLNFSYFLSYKVQTSLPFPNSKTSLHHKNGFLYAAVLVFLILGLLATSCFAQDPGAEPTQPPSATPIPPTLSLNAIEFDKYHGEGTSLFQLKYCIDCGEKMTMRVHPGAAPTQLPSATPTPPTLSLNAIEFGKYHLDGEGCPLGKLKYCLDSEKKMTMRVHPGEFFRERMLTKGVMMQMVDLSDNLPKMSFLPKNILAKLSQFSTSNIHKMMKVLLNVSVSEDGRVEKMMRKSLALCEGSAGPGEVRKCVKSMNEMITSRLYCHFSNFKIKGFVFVCDSKVLKFASS